MSARQRQRRNKAEMPVYAFIRKGRSLVPEFDFDAKLLESVAEGERVRIELRQFRNVDRLRAYWMMLGDVVDATDCAPSASLLHEALKLEIGIVEHVRMPNGYKVALPGSIAFDRLTEQEFVTFFRRAEEFLAATFGYVREAA